MYGKEIYTDEDVREAQKAMDFYPDASPFWDTDDGQEKLEIARLFELVSTNTNRDRCRIHGESFRATLAGV